MADSMDSDVNDLTIIQKKNSTIDEIKCFESS